jgi:hypothetical protein
MGLQVLGLQAARAKGSEKTFDGQAMQPGTHLRWSFTPQLGFPPGAFWLLRRIAQPGEGQIPPPDAVRQAVDNPGYAANGPSGGLTNVTQGPLGNPCTCTGCACECCDQAASAPGDTDTDPVSNYVAPTDSAVLARVAPNKCRCMCCCGGDPQGGAGNNGGQVGGKGGPGWTPHGPEWGPPDKQGWGLWGEPFTLPVTSANWPARYFGAPDPLTTSAPVVAARDLDECVNRLTGLDLLGGMSHAEMLTHLARLRSECHRLVVGWPSEPNYAVALGTSPDGTNAPQLSLRLVEQLQLAALSPYLARSLGLYFVDRDAKPSVAYDYCIVGVWPQFAMPVLLSPGSAPRGALATGHALFDGMEIVAEDKISQLHAWQRDDGSGAFNPTTDPGAPLEVRAAFTAATAGVAPGSWPESMLAAQVDLPSFPWGPPPLPDAVICRIGLANPVAEVGITLAGTGTVTARAAGAVVATANFSTSTLAWQLLAAPDPVNAPIDTIELTSAAGLGSVVVVAYIGTTPVADSTIGVRYALVHAPPVMKKPARPATPVAVFRKRSAEVEMPGPTIVPRSVFDVQWVPPPPAPQSGDPVTDPMGLPAPDSAVGYLAQLTDSDPSAVVDVPRLIAAASQPTPADSPLVPAPRILRFMASGLADPRGGYQFRTAGFGLFGQLGSYSVWSKAIGVENIAGAPSSLRLRSFDNSSVGGGTPQPAVNPAAWVGGTLSVRADWAGSTFLTYPDIRSARLSVAAVDSMTGEATSTLAETDFVVPAPAVMAYVLESLVPDPARNVVYALTTPPLPAPIPPDPTDPSAPPPPPASLTLVGAVPGGGTDTQHFTVRPGPVDPTADIRPPGIVATLPGGPVSRLVANPDAFIGQPAYLVQGVAVPLTVAVPLSIPIDQTTARGQATVTSSRAASFDASEVITDPNNLVPSRLEPDSTAVGFTGAQYLVPPSPPTPVHIVDHRWYQPADFNGNATYDFGGGQPDAVVWDTSAGPPAVSGYILERAPSRSLALADVKRRLMAGLADANPAIGGRNDLARWIAALPTWLQSFNVRTFGANVAQYLNEASVLSNAVGQRAFIDHFYGGLLDDELCVLADVPGNIGAFARVNPKKVEPGSTITDTVKGNGHGRTLYKLSALNQAGSVSTRTGAAGPIYTQAVRASRAPVLYRVQAAVDALIVAWALDDNTDVAGYLVYRADDPTALVDLRWWGTDPTHPADASTLAGPTFDPTAWQGFALSAGPVDPRLVAVIGDPRVFARDHPESDMAEIPLPPGGAPDEVLGVYRLDEFAAAAPPQTQPQAFNYWLPDTGSGDGTAQVITVGGGAAARSRITGLRLGLGQGVPAVVVARYGTTVRALGTLPIRRATFVDAAVTGSSPATPTDADAVTGWTAPDLTAASFYTVVAVDIAGNRSPAATAYGARALTPSAP